MVKKRFKKKNGNRKKREPALARLASSFAALARKAAIVGVLAFAFYSGMVLYRAVVTSPTLEVSVVEVTGNLRISEEEIVELAGISRDGNILTLDLAAVERSLKTHPFIKEVIIRKKLPDTVQIEIKEREPVALVMLSKLHIMDSSGGLIKSYRVADALDLPIITGGEHLIRETVQGARMSAEVVALLKVLGEARSTGGAINGSTVSEIHVDPVYGLTLYTLDGGVRIELGTGGYSTKLGNLERVIEARGDTLDGASSVILSVARGVVLKLVGAGGKQARAGSDGGVGDGARGRTS